MADYSLGTAHGQIKIDADTSGVDQTEKALGRVDKAGQTTEQAMDKTSRGVGIAGAAIAGGLALAVKTAGDFEFQMSAIQSVSGATAPQMDKIRDAALRIGTDTKYSATEAAGAMEELAKAGVPLEDILGGVADSTVALAAASGVDLTKAATIAADSMNMFGLGASDMTGIVDVLAQTANASSIGMEDLGMAFGQVGAVAHMTGMSLGDTASAIGQLGSAGIKGSDAGTSLKTMLMNLQPQTKKAANEMRDLGIITKDGTNRFYDQNGKLKSLRDIQQILHDSTSGLTNAQKQQALQTMFGSDAIRAAAIMADGGAAAFDAFAKKQEGAGTAAEQAKIRQDNFNSAVEQLGGALETMAISIGSALTPMLKGLANGLGAVVGWFNSLSPTTQSWVAGILAGSAGLLLLTAGILKTIMMFRSMIQTMQTLRILSTATQSSFIKTAAVAVFNFTKMALSAALNAAKTVASWVAAGIQTVASWAATAAAATLNAAKVAAAWAANAAKTVASFVLMSAQATLNAAKIAAAWLITNGAAMAKAMIQMGIALATTVGGWILMAVTAMANAVIMAAAWFIALGPIGWIIAGLALLIGAVILFWDDIKGWFQKGAQWVAQIMQQAWQWIVDKWNGIKNAFSAAGAWVGQMMSNFGNMLRNVWNTIIGWFRQIPGWIGGIFSGAASWLLNAGRNILNGLWNGIKAIWNSAKSWLSGLGSTIIGIFAGAGSWLASAGKNLVQGLWNGISGAAGWLWGKVKGWASGIVNNVLGFFGIGSPSKLFEREIGRWLPAGLAVGIDANADDAISSALRMAEAVTSSVSMTAGGPDAFWDGTTLGAGFVPPSREVSSYSASQGEAATTGSGANIVTNIYNPVVEKASDSEARRLRALSALGAF